MEELLLREELERETATTPVTEEEREREGAEEESEEEAARLTEVEGTGAEGVAPHMAQRMALASFFTLHLEHSQAEARRNGEEESAGKGKTEERGSMNLLGRRLWQEAAGRTWSKYELTRGWRRGNRRTSK